MTLKKLILAALIFVVYFLFYYMGTYEIRISLSITACVVTVLINIYFVYILYKHEQVKEYFWNNLKTEDTSFINYGFHRSAFARDGSTSHPFSWYWKKEVKFQEKRNTIIIKYNKGKGDLLISLEKSLCNLEVLMFFLFAVTSFSFYYA